MQVHHPRHFPSHQQNRFVYKPQQGECSSSSSPTSSNKTIGISVTMYSKQSIVIASSLLALVCVHAEPPTSYGPPGFTSGGPSRTTINLGGGTGGSSGSFFSGEGGAPEPYSYAYEVKDGPTGNDYSSQANSDGKRVTGEYRVLLPDGRRQIVKYTADDGGYNANVVYEGQARYPVTVAKSSGGGGAAIVAGGSSGGTTIIASGPTGGSGSFSGYRY